MNPILQWFDRLFSRMSDRGIWLTGIGMVGVLFVIDLNTGYEIAFSLFYLLPIGVAAWYSGRRAGIAFSILSAVCWYTADVGAGSTSFYSHAGIPIWNACVRFTFFLIVTCLLVSFHEAILRERQLARSDSLTGLLTRRALEERLEYDIARSVREGLPLSVVFIDLDRFKTINDRHGHAEGDRLLRVVGDTLRHCTRRIDAVARLGGDEFVLVLPDTGRPDAEAAIGKIRDALRLALQTAGFPVTASIGVVSGMAGNATAEMLVAQSDRLMYEAKTTRDAVVFRDIAG